MPARDIDEMAPQTKILRQPLLLGHNLPSAIDEAGSRLSCNIVEIEKRRAGGQRYWCLAHRADATAKGGIPSSKCRQADLTPLSPDDILQLDVERYRGGIALWGAVPGVYDTTRMPMDRGIHVHARRTVAGDKVIDATYRAIHLTGKSLPSEGVIISEYDAIYFMVSSVFGFEMSYVICTHCGYPHLDKDWFSVHPHRRHLCASCGKKFYDKLSGIGNPIEGIRDYYNAGKHRLVPAKKKLNIQQSQFPGGIQIWGSNPALFWTGRNPEEEGIHVHAFLEGETKPELDDTFYSVTVDGIELDARMVRVLMAQSVMPMLKGRIRSMRCPDCGHSGFDIGPDAFTPKVIHICTACECQFPTQGRIRNVVLNPLPAILAELAEFAPRSPQQHRIDLLPESR